EFKYFESWMNPLKLASKLDKYLPSFFNQEESKIFLGIEDDGTVIGLSLDSEWDDLNFKSLLSTSLISSCFPPLPNHSIQITMIPVKIQHPLQVTKDKSI